MNKVKAIVFEVMMSAAITASAASEATAITDEVGKDVRLSLEFNPTTGYGWMIRNLPGGLTFVSGGHEQPGDCPKDAVGCDGEEVLHFIGERKGESTLELIYGRSFDKSNWQGEEVKVVTK